MNKFYCILPILALAFVSVSTTTAKVLNDTLPQTNKIPQRAFASLDSIMQVLENSKPKTEADFNNIDEFYSYHLDKIEKTIALDYNNFVRSYIESYRFRQQELVSKMLGLSEYYFPIFEQSLKNKGLPEELKYMAIVESALKPTAVSRVGATGPWQFMYTTAREYGLKMNSYVDERRDPVASSIAAAEYLTNMYDRFGDWLLAIAAYNCGGGNVEKAIERSGGKMSFWAIRPYLPQETRNYVPKYIAMVYIMKYASKHHIEPILSGLPAQGKTVWVEKRLSLSSISSSLGMDTDELLTLNSKYKRRIVNGSTASPQKIVIPTTKAMLFARLINGASAPRAHLATNNTSTGKTVTVGYYRVRKGDALTSIANDFDCTVQDLKIWNNLQSDKLTPGQKLIIKREESEKAQQSKVLLGKTYKVKKGDTLYSIAKRFNTSVESLKKMNGINNEGGLRIGMQLTLNPKG